MAKLDIAFKTAMFAVAVFAPGVLFYKLYGAYLGIGIAVLVGGGLFSLISWGFGMLWRRRKIARNPLDPSLRSLVGSDLSWENCATADRFCAAALPAFRFLVEEEDFKPAVMNRELMLLTFRRGDVIVNVGEGPGPSGPQPVLDVVLALSPQSFRPIAGVGFGGEDNSLGDGYRGAAFFLRSNLDRIIAELREEVSAKQPAV